MPVPCYHGLAIYTRLHLPAKSFCLSWYCNICIPKADYSNQFCLHHLPLKQYVLLLEHVLLGIHNRNSTLLIVFSNRVMPLNNHQFFDKMTFLYSLVSLCSTSHFLNSNF